MDIDTLQKTLYKYKLTYVSSDLINITYNGYCISYDVNSLLVNNKIIKFIHDNISYIEDLILLNGYKRGNSCLCYYEKENKMIAIEFSYVATYYVYDRINKILNNTDTLFDKLREFLDVDLPYKHVIKNE